MAALAVVAACAADPAPPEAAPPASEPDPEAVEPDRGALAPPGLTEEGQDPDRRFAVGTRTTVFEDTTRPTAANADAPELASRTLPTTVFYPAEGEPGAPGADPTPDAAPATDAGPFPLVVFSHGFTGTGPAYTELLRVWAANGYVVAAPTFPLSSAEAPGGPALRDVANQPADVSFLIDELTSPDAALAELIDPDRVGLAGHSLGGITSLGTAYNDCCLDPDVDAVVEMAGLLYPFDGEYFGPEVDGADGPPLLIIHGTDDETVPYNTGEAAFAESSVATAFVTLVDGAHIPPFLVGLASPEGELVARSALDFFDAHPTDDEDALEELEARVAEAGPTEATLERSSG